MLEVTGLRSQHVRKDMPVPPIRFGYESGDVQQIAGYRWDPPGPPVAARQLTHGMGEHALRYDQFALALNRKGPGGLRPGSSRSWRHGQSRWLAGHGRAVS